MITLAVCGVHEVPLFTQANLTDIVSIGDPAHPTLCAPQPPPDFTPFPDTRIHRFEFQDICHMIETSPNATHIGRLIEVIDSLLAREGDVRVLFHCQAGIARSTAAAFIMCVRAGMTYQQAYDHVLRVRGVLNPNMLMMKLADDLMEQGGKMLGFILTHRWNGEEGNKDAREWAESNGYAFIP
jgi:predicted protein tyrosine phosphatase